MKRFTPFWLKDRIENEILVFCEIDGQIVANLAFDQPKNLIITDNFGKKLQSGVDYKQNANKVILLNENYFYFKNEWLGGKNLPQDIPSENERYKIKGCLLLDPKFLREKQFYASYDCSLTSFPELLSDKLALPNTYKKLTLDKKLKIALFGDSISNAANSSYEMGFSGYEHWIEKPIKIAQKLFNAQIDYINISRSGYGTDWAVSATEEKLNGENPDLVIIAFGMNDGAANLSPKDFKTNVRIIMQKIIKMNSAVEFILVATPLPNAECKQVFIYQKDYYNALKELVSEHVTVVNMTATSSFFMQRKNYIEISGNNLNHPNDFFYRVYEDSFSELFYRLKENHENRLDFSDCFSLPTFEKVNFSVLPENISAGYLVSTIRDKQKKTFCFISYPENVTEKSPAVVLVHGAGGNAFYKWAESWSKQGYVAISLDINCTHFTDDNLLERKPNPFAGELFIGGFAHIGKNAYDSWIYYSVSQIMQANSYLRTLPQVDASKIGLVGISWGGVVCLNTLGVDNRFSAGVIIYSAGFITEDLLGKETGLFNDYANKRFYDSFYDPRNYVQNINVPVLMNAGLDDGAFSPISRARTADLFIEKPSFAVIPNLLHDNESNFENVNAFSFMNEQLKGDKNRASIDLEVAKNEVVISCDNICAKITLVATAEQGNLRKVKWEEIALKQEDGKFIAKLPEWVKYYTAYAEYKNGLYSSTRIFENI